MIGIVGRGRCWAVAAAVMSVALVAVGTPGCGSRHGTVPVEGVVTFAGLDGNDLVGQVTPDGLVFDLGTLTPR